MHNYKKWMRGGMMLVGLTGLSVNALALDWGVDAAAGLRYESNPTKVHSNEKSDFERTGELNGFVDHKGAHTLLRARYQARHESWNDNSFDNRNTLTGYGTFSWQPTDYFRGYIEDRRRDLVVNNTQADISSNHSVRDVVTTGMEFQARVTPVDSLGVRPVYQRVSYREQSGTDSTRPGTTLFWRHLLSEVSTISLNVFAEKTLFDGSTLSDIKRQNFYVKYNTKLSRITYTLQAGYTWTDPDTGSSTNGALLRFDANYSYQNQTVHLFVTHVITDNSIGLDESTLAGPSYNPQDTNIQQFDVVTRDQAYISYRIDLPGGRWDLGANYRYDKQNFEMLPNDERQNQLEFLAGYRFNSAVRINGYADYEKRDFLSGATGRSDDLYRFGMAIEFRLFRNGLITVGGEHEERDSDLSSAGYTNNVAFARIRLKFP